MVGKLLPSQMVARLGRNLNAVKSTLQTMGYVGADLYDPLGLTAIGVVRHLNLPPEVVYKHIASGVLKVERKQGPKDFFIAWPVVRRYERYIRARLNQRQRALARIHEKTITKQQFMRLLNLSETHGARYLEGHIVRAWKIPCQWYDAPRHRWEWRVSLKDTLRVKKLRAKGRLRLNTKTYRRLQQKSNAEIIQLRHERRLGLRPARGPRHTPIPGWYSVAQVAQLAKVSDQVVYTHVALGRLKSKRVRVGKREFVVINPASVPAYLKWCKRENKYTGPLHPRQTQYEQIRRAGMLTLTEAAEQFNVSRGTLSNAITRRYIPFQYIAGMRALRPSDVRRYARTLIHAKK